ncbi:hypothetical protein CVV26_00825 [Candidatus Kuenenbacteria bacterium HGW-Kuenenbacteria-1]|uniref:EF-hand domain-containing protein n=1 Tax=Candidatus Kuenenbacteria bacterium HGW-Kuenenbacteria-1 TaxID=2013812 RepID=A0A2N1UNV2_9BACT|nr:MAG: hypothetical protein CVV26_00825 [Candidatus Kuenenbacteria bacterium HGW-Kuenenbacteria-1]
MRKKYFFLILILFFSFCFPLKTEAQEKLKGVGFLTKNIWYSKEPFFDGDTIRIYTIINNNTDEDIIGKILFYNDKKLIGSSNFSAISRGYGIIIWIDWKAINGKHLISAEINEAKIAKKDGTFIDIVSEYFKSFTDLIDVDFDTDKDKIGNKEDKDDDNDGLLDKDELFMALNPLNPDTDQDGVIDSIDTKPKDPSISKEISSFQESPNFTLGIKESQEKIIPLIMEVPEKINQFFEKKEEKLKFKKEEIEKNPEIKNFKEIKKEIFSINKEKRDKGVAQFKEQFKAKEEKKKITNWIFLDFLNFFLEKRIIIFYFLLILFFIVCLKCFKRRK